MTLFVYFERYIILIFLTFLFFAVSGKKSLGKQQLQRHRHQQLAPPTSDVHSTSPEENMPSYMRSTSASTKKERPISAASVNMSTPRRRSSIGQTQSQLDLRTAVASDEDSSSEENMKRSKNRRRSSSHDRR